MLNETKTVKLIESIKNYQKQFLNGSITDLDESGTRIMVNHLLTDVLGYTAIHEVKTEYMIKGTYADYMIQVDGKRLFLVEVKAFSLTLNESHLRQSVNYAANEGVEWAILTNGKQVDLYKVIFEKPISNKLVFSLDLTKENPKAISESIQYLTKDVVLKKGLEVVWNKTLALTPESLSKILLSFDIVNDIRKKVNNEFGTKFENDEVQQTLLRIISEKVEITNIKVPKLIPPIKKSTTIVNNNFENLNTESK